MVTSSSLSKKKITTNDTDYAAGSFGNRVYPDYEKFQTLSPMTPIDIQGP
jgi:hypothetical protein